MKRLIPAALLAASLASGCDEGRIYNDLAAEDSRTGVAARLTACISNTASWPQGYSLVLAGFAEGNDYALISKAVEPAGDGSVDITLTGIPRDATSIELCVIDRLRRRVTVFMAESSVGATDTVRLNSGVLLDISMYNTIQRDIFNTTCIQCHGGSNFAAAGLDLTERKSYVSLVGVESVKVADALRVSKGNSDASVLFNILSTNGSASWKYDHSVEIPAQERLELIKNWIDAGAAR